MGMMLSNLNGVDIKRKLEEGAARVADIETFGNLSILADWYKLIPCWKGS
jgi:hypothetical protein